ncbi:MAG: UDP-N-acetylglucosamine 1-carboxyvinyltransferase [Candidatus Aerophobetes bacterium]|nr:UDP-N-acetylglucosamine 1-carboxyvinyltransferase [Candidatus Aerophobetes bacterium]
MEKFIIRGGVPLKGKIRVKGAKNSALPLMAGCLLPEGKSRLENIPHLTDITAMAKVLEGLGAEIKREDSILEINTEKLSSYEPPSHLVKMMRASILVLGPILARFGYARVPLPGGCNIGVRPVNLHLEGLKKLGAEIKVKNGYIEAHTKRRLKGGKICLNLPSVGATENLLLAASLAEGTTLINNASCSPEVIDLINFLKKMGAEIENRGEKSIKVEGVKELRPVSYSIIPDRIEVGTFIIAGIITRGEITIEGVCMNHLRMPLEKLREMNAEMEITSSEVKIKKEESTWKPIKIETLPYPGFPTDIQPQITTLACLAQGVSIIVETIFKDRFTHLSELRKMGADIERKEGMAIVRGVPLLQGTPVVASDIRGGAALILAGLTAKGVTEIHNISHIDRGYEKIDERLLKLGANISRMSQ